MCPSLKVTSSVFAFSFCLLTIHKILIMINIYLKLMISSIYTAKNNGFMSDIWKFTSSLYFAFATNNYVMFLYLSTNKYIFNNHLDVLNLQIISGKYNFILNMLIYFYLPILILNYLFLFRYDKFRSLIKTFNHSYNKKGFALYFIFSLLFMFATFFI